MFSGVVKRLLQQKKTTTFSRINKRNYLGQVDDVLIEGKKEWTRISKVTAWWQCLFFLSGHER